MRLKANYLERGVHHQDRTLCTLTGKDEILSEDGQETHDATYR